MPKKLPSIPALLKNVRESFKKIKDHRKKKIEYSLQDILMSGLAIFGYKIFLITCVK